MKFHLKHLVAISALAIAGQASAQVLFYEHADYQGRSVTTDKALDNFLALRLQRPRFLHHRIEQPLGSLR